MNNERVMIIRECAATKLFIAKQAGGFGGQPNMVWNRRLSNQECEAMLENPWRMFDEPDGRAMTPNVK